MSYANATPAATQGPSPRHGQGAVRQSPRHGTGLVGRTLGGDSAYMEDTRKIQEAIKQIQQHASDVRKEARVLGTAQATTTQKRVQDSVRATKTAEDEARRLLQSLAVGGAGTPSEQNMRRLTQQKLSESLVSSIKSFEDSWKAYEAASAENATRQQQPSASIGSSRGLEMGDWAASDAAGGESSQQVQRQKQEIDVTEAEVVTHTAMVEEMVQDVSTLNSEIKGLQRAMVDLAQTTTAQGDVLDSIESHMQHSVSDTSGATEQLVQASQSQQRGNKMLCCMVVVCLVLCLSIIIVVVLKRN